MPFYPQPFKIPNLAKPSILRGFQPFCFSLDSNTTVSTCKEEIDSISNIYFAHKKVYSNKHLNYELIWCHSEHICCFNIHQILQIQFWHMRVPNYPINVNCYQKAQFGTHCVPSWKNGIKLTHISQSQKQLRLFKSEITCIFSGTLAL